MKRTSPLFESAAILGVAMVIAKATGFAREIVLAAFFGAGTVSDAFILAFTIPDMLLVFLSAAVVAAYIPMYYRVEGRTDFTRNIMTCLLIIGLVFSAVFSIFPGVLVRLFAFQIERETFEIAVFFLRYMVWSAVFILFSDVYGARLETDRKFFVSGMRSVWRNFAVILGIVLGALTSFNIFIALAPVAGTALGTLVLGIACKKNGFVYRPFLDIRSPQLRQMLVLVLPIFLATATSQINAIVGRNFAASLPTGSISYLYYAGKVAQLFTALLGSAFSVVLFPHMSKLAADGDIEKLKSTLSRSILYITAVMLPVAIGVFFLAQPGIRILFERGEFSAEATQHTAATLRMYAPLLVAGGVSPVLLRAFHAIQNTKSPAVAAIISVVAGIILNFVLIGPLGTEGLALAGSLSGILAAVLLFVLLRKKIGGLRLGGKLPEFLKIFFAAGIMGLGVWRAANALPLMSAPVWQSALLCAALAIAAAVVYFLLLWLMRSKILVGKNAPST